MKRIRLVGLSLVASLAVTSSALTASAQGTCKGFEGKLSQTLIAAPNDPFGRFLGTTTGAIKGSQTSVFTSLVPTTQGSLLATTSESFLTGPGDLLTATGAQEMIPIVGQPIGTVTSTAILTITGGTGKYAGATGSLTVSGIGRNLFGPNVGLGVTTFELDVAGEVCVP
jgi:hypothetical protein